jgi:hypothetical protein
MSFDGRDLPSALRGKGIPDGLPSTVQKRVFSETATSTDAVASGTYRVRLLATAACHVAFATTPTATTASMLVPANSPEYFHIEGGQKVSVLSANGTATGTLCVTEMR